MWNRPDPDLARHDTHKKAVPCDLCGMEEAEMLFIPALGRDAVVVEVVRVAIGLLKANSFPRGAPVSCPLLHVESEKQRGTAAMSYVAWL